MRVVFLHLDLGIGGAEQLVVNAAISLLRRGHEVTIYTTHHNPSHSFSETVGDGALAEKIRVHGDFLPLHVIGRAAALCATMRMLFLALAVLLNESRTVDAIFLDGVSAPMPLLRLLHVPILFYCHYPDKLLCVDRSRFLKRLYRAPLDWLEEFTTGMASTIAVNSKFTAGIFSQAFERLAQHRQTCILYPPLNFENYAIRSGDGDSEATLGPFASINRFERKKNVALALEALAILRSQLIVEKEDMWKFIKLIIAGGYDSRVQENIDVMQDMKDKVKALGLEEHVIFKPNISDSERASLLCTSACIIYTPDMEHFGIVPLESMYAGTPVIAVASGGPLETVLDGETGFLCPSDPECFARAMMNFVRQPSLTSKMGIKCRKHAVENFGLEAFGTACESALVHAAEAHGEETALYLKLAVFVALCASALMGWISM